MELSLNKARETLPIIAIPLVGLLILIGAYFAVPYWGWWTTPLIVLGISVFGIGSVFFGIASMFTDWRRW